MKIATVQQLPLQWPDILRWVSAGEEVQINDREKTIARVLPPAGTPGHTAAQRSALDLPPLQLGRILKPLTAGDDLLEEMLDDSRAILTTNSRDFTVLGGFTCVTP